MNSERFGDACVTGRRRLKQGRIKQAFQHYLATQYQLELRNSTVYNYSKPKTFDSTLNESAIKRRRSRDNNDDDASKCNLKENYEDNYLDDKQHQNIHRGSKKRKISNRRMSEMSLAVDENSDVDDQNYVPDHHQHRHRRHRHHHHHHRHRHDHHYNHDHHCNHDHHHCHHHRRRYLSSMNCYYPDKENNREQTNKRVSLKSMTLIMECDDGKIRKRSLTSELGNDDLGIEYQEIHYIKPSPVKRCSSKTNFFRRCSSIISFGKSLSRIDLTKNNNEINTSKKNQNNSNVNETYKRVDKDAVQTGSTNQRNDEVSNKLDKVRASLANDCLSKFGKHCVPLMKILNKDNIYNKYLDNVLKPAEYSELKQPNFLKCILLSQHLTNITSGLYITCLLHSSGKVLVTSHDLLPAVKVDFDQVTEVENHFYWLMKMTSDWSLLNNLKHVMKKELSSSKKAEPGFVGGRDVFPIRYAILKAVNILQKLIGIEKLGNLHSSIISGDDYNVFLFVNTDTRNEFKSSSSSTFPTSSSIPSPLSLTWISLKKLSSFSSQSKHLPSSPSPNKKCKPNGTLKDLTGSCENLLTEARKLHEKMEDGVYISYLTLTCHLQNGLSILVSKQHPNAFPSIKLDDQDENFDENTTMIDKCLNILNIKNTNIHIVDEGFREMMTSKIFQLINIFKTPLPATPEPSPSSSSLPSESTPETPAAAAHRLHTSVFPLDDKVNMIILSPPPSLICPLINHSAVSPSSSCFFVPIRTFEMVQLATYQPQIYRKYCHLSVILEIATEICKRRKVVSETDVETVSISSRLSELKREVDETWTKYRWLGDVITQARLPSSENFISLQRLF